MSLYKNLLIVIVAFLVACNSSKELIDLGASSGCDIARSMCKVSSAGIELSLRLNGQIKPLETFKLELQITGVEVDNNTVKTNFSMKNMDMGLNQYRLNFSHGIWLADIILPVCSNKRTDWLAQVEFMSDGNIYKASFPFQAQPR